MKRGIQPKRPDSLSYEERIKQAEKEIELFKILISLRDYFHPVSHYRGSYVVELRRIIALQLLEKKLSWKEIGRVFNQNHTTIMNLVNNNKNFDYVKETVTNNYQQWIIDKLYPKTVIKRVPNEFTKTGISTIVDYKLVPFVFKNK
jgi:hypothetical protein